MSAEFGIAPDAQKVLHRHILQLVADEDQDMVHLHFLPDGYNPSKNGIAIVVTDDPTQKEESDYVRNLVRVSVFGPNHDRVRKLGRELYAALTSGISGIGLGIDESESAFFGSGPSTKPTGFVSTMSISVGLVKFFTRLT